MYGAYANSHRHFGPYYDASRPLAPFTRPANVYATDVNTTVAELLQSDRPGRLVRYLSQDLSALPPELEADLQPLQPLLAPNPQRSSVNLWLGPAGAIAHGHYDGYHNAFVQLKGRKRFILLPPTAWSVLGVYPFLHPHHAQAAANLSRIFPELALPDLMKTEAAAMSEEHGRLRKQLQDQLVVADLQPGDVLYLPPLWFHHVVAVSLLKEKVTFERFLL